MNATKPSDWAFDKARKMLCRDCDLNPPEDCSCCGDADDKVTPVALAFDEIAAGKVKPNEVNP